MPSFKLSKQAEADMEAIARYTLETWGADQSASYISELEDYCQSLADNPSLGRKCDEIESGFVASNRENILSSIKKIDSAFLYHVFYTNACCPVCKSLRKQIKRLSSVCLKQFVAIHRLDHCNRQHNEDLS